MAVKSRQALRTGPVTASQALRIGRRFGVTLDLSNDIELAGKWKHGWIPLDAVAAAVKAKRYHGGATHELTTHSGSIHVRNVRDDANNRNMSVATVVKDHRQGVTNLHAPGANVWVARAQVHPLSGGGGEVRGKGRGGSLVESMRRPSSGRSKAAIPAERRQRTGVPAANLKPGDSYEHTPGGTRVHILSGPKPAEDRFGRGMIEYQARREDTGATGAVQFGPGGKVFGHRPASLNRAQQVAQERHRRIENARVARDEGAALKGAGAPRRESHISAKQLANGRTKLTDRHSGESVSAVHVASLHDQGHTIEGVRLGLVHTHDDYGKSHAYDPSTGRAVDMAGVASRLNGAELKRISERMPNTAEGRAAKAELVRRSGPAAPPARMGISSPEKAAFEMGVANTPAGILEVLANRSPQFHRTIHNEAIAELRRRGYVETKKGWRKPK